MPPERTGRRGGRPHTLPESLQAPELPNQPWPTPLRSTVWTAHVRKSECGDAKEDEILEWVPAGLNIGALSSAKASSSRIYNRLPGAWKRCRRPRR
jgi:hypothetical protein